MFNSAHPLSTLSPVLQHLRFSNQPCPATRSTLPFDLCIAFTFKLLLSSSAAPGLSHKIQPHFPWEPPSSRRKWLHISHGLILLGFFVTDKGTIALEILFDCQVLDVPWFASFYYVGITLFIVLLAEAHRTCTYFSHSSISSNQKLLESIMRAHKNNT